MHTKPGFQREHSREESTCWGSKCADGDVCCQARCKVDVLGASPEPSWGPERVRIHSSSCDDETGQVASEITESSQIVYVCVLAT